MADAAYAAGLALGGGPRLVKQIVLNLFVKLINVGARFCLASASFSFFTPRPPPPPPDPPDPRHPRFIYSFAHCYIFMFRSESPPRAPSCGSLRLDAIVLLSLLTKYRNFTDIVVQPMRILYNIGCRVGYAILALTLCYLTTLFNDARQITIVTKFPASTLPAGESVCALLFQSIWYRVRSEYVTSACRQYICVARYRW